MSDIHDELGAYAACESLREYLWTVPVYDEHGQRSECKDHPGQARYTLSPAGLEEAVKRNPEMSFTPEDYARAQKMLDRALRFDPETRARWERRFQTLEALMAEDLAAELDPTEKGGLTPAELAERLGISEPEAAHELRILADLGMIDGPT
jgi:hypothetical protein